MQLPENKSLSLQIEDLEGEVWKDVMNFSDYQISNLGRCKQKKLGRINMGTRILNKNPVFSFFINKKTHTFLIKNLVANHFLENPDNLTECVYIDGDINNNLVENIKWDEFSLSKNGWRKCNTCFQKKDHSDFIKTGKNGGYVGQCYDCRLVASNKKYYKFKDKYADKKKKYLEDNKGMLLERARKRYAKNKEKIQARRNLKKDKNKINQDTRKRYREKMSNPETREIYKTKQKEYRAKYREQELASMRKRRKERFATDIKYKIECNLRRSLKNAVKNNWKQSSVLDLLDCSVDFFRLYIESRFEPGMTWENWGRGEDKWNMDHILPVEVFDVRDIRQQKLCFHFLNLRPLWETENVRKSDKLPNGLVARYMTDEEKLNYLKQLGFSL